MKQKIIGVAGFKNAGKTTLVEKLVLDLTRRGFRVSTVKHAHHSFDIDHEGRDSFRHRKAGATEVAVVSSGRWAIIHELRNEAEPSLADLGKGCAARPALRAPKNTASTMEPSPADHRTRERHERLVHFVVAVVADPQALELVHQCKALLDVPAVYSKPAAVRRVAPRNLSSDGPRRQLHERCR